MAWVQLSSVSVTASSKIVVIDVGSTANIKPGDGLQIAGFELYEVEGVFASQLTLKNAWNNASQTNMAAVIVPTFGDFNTAIEALRTATSTTQGNFAAMEQWWTENADIIFEDYEGNQHSVRSAKKMDTDIAELEQRLNDDIMAVSTTYVMTEAQSQAIRKQNREMYAASDFVHHGKHEDGGNYASINEGLMSRTNSTFYANALVLGASNTVDGNSKTNHPIFNITGLTTELLGINQPDTTYKSNLIRLPPAPDGTVTYDSADGTVTQHVDAATAFAHADTSSTIEVVTERVDLVGLELFLEEITDDEVFPFCIQNQSTTFGDTGIATVLSSRPDSYFQVYDGQTGISKGRCVLWSTLSDTEKRQVTAYLGESFFVGKNGYLVQKRVRQRSVAGARNGDWHSIDPNLSGSYTLQLAPFPSTRVAPQGRLDVAPTDTTSNNYFANTDSNYNDDKIKHKGVWTSRRNDIAYEKSYFYVIATVPRLNQGAYHPKLNPLGVTGFNRVTSDANGDFWYGSIIEPTNTSVCFNFVEGLTNNVDAGAVIGFGDISSGLSRRPDGRYYNAIYASGQGGVIDRRLKYGAWDASSAEQAAVVREEVKNGSYRGREKLKYSKAFSYTATSSYTPSRVMQLPEGHDVDVGDVIQWLEDGDTLIGEFVVTDIGSDYVAWSSSIYTYERVLGVTYKCIAVKETNITVEGEFTQTDVIGDPAEILATPQLADGWLGSWGGLLTIDGATTYHAPLTRKSLVTSSKRIYTTDSGSTWTSSSSTVNAVINTVPYSTGNSSLVLIENYTVFAKQTEQSDNLPILHGEGGLSNVFADIWHDISHGALLAESTLGIILKSGGSAVWRSHYLLGVSLDSDLKMLDASNYRPEHSSLILNAPDNESHGFKVLFHQTEVNNQAGLNVIANEMIYDTTAGNWGDDATMKILNGTFPDNNGNICKASIHKIKPYGWIKNDI